MKKLTFLLALFIGGAAHADIYKEITTEHKARTLVTGPDTFPHRLRYWFMMEDGSPSVYEVVEKKHQDEWVDLLHPNDNPALIIKGDTLRFERRFAGKVVSTEEYEKKN
ncbi:hypothetical protein [Kosakonia sp. MUSA4]|uniref:hypothetical protein n=1 Tax=Kosakonia sp. MUSA4 TaxID=2067958 RepID=UPI001598BDED|nr:hypothetical protein [Kosakonia sp. MUSA4]QJT78954.1 hypothetical protein C0557_02180 [Kosakonia sp. MUSA4]